MTTFYQDYQNALFEEIKGRRAQERASPKGLEIYQNNLQGNACRALSISFPVVRQLLGDRLFSHLTSEFLHAHSFHFGDWGEWGDDFPAWIKSHFISEEHPYLPDCATLDWLHHQCERDCNYSLDANSFLQLADENAENGHFTCNPTLRSFSSAYPAYDIWNQYQRNEEQSFKGKSKERETVRHFNNTAPQNIILWRQQWKVQVEVISPLEETWLTFLKKGMPLGKALHTLENSGFSLEEWLPTAISQHKTIKFQLT